MIHGLDSVTPPSSAQIKQARDLGFLIWSGGFAGPGIAYNWSDADFQRVLAGGLETLAYCSGWADPAAMKARAARLGIRICLDDEGEIRPDGSWVQGWLNTSGAGLYGNLPVHRGRAAPFKVLSDYVDTNPGATWVAGTAPPSVPHGWQWHGTTSLFGLSVDKSNFDDWFAPGGAHGASTGSITPTGDDQMNLSQKRAAVRVAYHAAFGRGPENDDALNGWASQIKDDGSNLDLILTQVVDSKEGQDHEAAVRAVLSNPAAAADHKHHNDGVDPASALTSEPV